MSSPIHTRTHILLSFPANPEMWILARMGVSAIAAQLDFAIGDVEDLRLAVNELCSSCALGATADSRIDLECSWNNECVEISCSVDQIVEIEDHSGGEAIGGVIGEITEAELSRRIIESLVDEHRIESPHDGVRRAWFRKEREPASR